MSRGHIGVDLCQLTFWKVGYCAEMGWVASAAKINFVTALRVSHKMQRSLLKSSLQNFNLFGSKLGGLDMENGFPASAGKLAMAAKYQPVFTPKIVMSTVLQ